MSTSSPSEEVILMRDHDANEARTDPVPTTLQQQQEQQQQSSQLIRSRIIQRGVLAVLAAISALCIGIAVGIYVLLGKIMPRVGFWKSFSFVVLFSSDFSLPCDVPLRAWIIGLIPVVVYIHAASNIGGMICGMLGGCAVHEILARNVCHWRVSTATHVTTVRFGEQPSNIITVNRSSYLRCLDYTVSSLIILWAIFGLVCALTADTCSQTAPALFYSSVLSIIVYFTAIATWLNFNIPMFCLGLAFDLGLYRSPPRTGCLEAQQVISYDLAIFDDENLPLECSICLEQFGQETDSEIRQTICGHVFHGACLEHWLRMTWTCPACRTDLSSQSESRPEVIIGRPAENGYMGETDQQMIP